MPTLIATLNTMGRLVQEWCLKELKYEGSGISKFKIYRAFGWHNEMKFSFHSMA